ncbi:CPBP family intramembrane glutamic endopeptidase [candidate division CSSED10-310 bacterium]|uniref:CPBP family intramembrane glutamic endopeptidase n=1 Tax=candidate division CSSED10-310 bacterium TaxID=2855610 RepID=A0ABV6YXI7_UNCC1
MGTKEKSTYFTFTFIVAIAIFHSFCFNIFLTEAYAESGDVFTPSCRPVPLAENYSQAIIWESLGAYKKAHHLYRAVLKDHDLLGARLGYLRTSGFLYLKNSNTKILSHEWLENSLKGLPPREKQRAETFRFLLQGELNSAPIDPRLILSTAQQICSGQFLSHSDYYILMTLFDLCYKRAPKLARQEVPKLFDLINKQLYSSGQCLALDCLLFPFFSQLHPRIKNGWLSSLTDFIEHYPAAFCAPKVAHILMQQEPSPKKVNQILQLGLQHWRHNPYWSEFVFRVVDQPYISTQKSQQLLKSILEHGSAEAQQKAAVQLADLHSGVKEWTRALDYYRHYIQLSQESNVDVRQSLFAALNYLYNQKKHGFIIDYYERHKTLWETKSFYVPRRIFGKSLFKVGRYEDALHQYESWYGELSEISNTPGVYDPRFFIIRTLIYLHPQVALSQIMTLFIGFVLPLLAFIIYYHNVPRARYFHKVAFVISVFILVIQFWSHARLDTLSMRTTFILITAFIRNFLLITAGSVLLLRCGLPCFPVLRFLGQPSNPNKLRVARQTLHETFLALLLMTVLTGVLYFMVQPEISPLLHKIGQYFQHPLITPPGYNQDHIVMINYVLVGAVVEELYTRLFALSLLLWIFKKRRGQYFLAVILTALIWAFSHAGMIDPEWYKIMQVSLMGMVLGILYLRRGIEATLLAHIALNLGGMMIYLVMGGG